MSDIKNEIMELKKAFNAKTDKELSEILGISYSAIDGWKLRKKLPHKYEKYIYNINTQNIRNNLIENMNITIEKLTITNKIEIELIKNFQKLPQKKQEYYQSLIKTEALKTELNDEEDNLL